MAKYIMNVPDEIIKFMNGKFDIFIEPEVKVGECRHYKVRLDDTEITPYTEPDREAIENEVWEFVSKLVWSFVDREILGMDIALAVRDMTYQDAKAKYDAWKKQKDEIRVGDEVKENTGLWTGVVVGFDEFDNLTIMDRSGKSCGGYKTRFFRKTGRHFDEVEELLKKMGDEFNKKIAKKRERRRRRKEMEDES